MNERKYSTELVERMARRLFMESTESRSGWTWPINGDWGRERDMERAEKALEFVLGEWITEHDREVWHEGHEAGMSNYSDARNGDGRHQIANPHEVSP